MFGEYEEAIQLYDQVLKDDESNEVQLKIPFINVSI
jgi:hypothetical protein